VLFAGYQMPHPLVNEMKLKIQTRPGVKASDGADYTPQRALTESIHALQTELEAIKSAFLQGVQNR
jgi:DNA-directed RNA polymerase subunit L